MSCQLDLSEIYVMSARYIRDICHVSLIYHRIVTGNIRFIFPDKKVQITIQFLAKFLPAIPWMPK